MPHDKPGATGRATVAALNFMRGYNFREYNKTEFERSLCAAFSEHYTEHDYALIAAASKFIDGYDFNNFLSRSFDMDAFEKGLKAAIGRHRTNPDPNLKVERPPSIAESPQLILKQFTLHPYHKHQFVGRVIAALNAHQQEKTTHAVMSSYEDVVRGTLSSADFPANSETNAYKHNAVIEETLRICAFFDVDLPKNYCAPEQAARALGNAVKFDLLGGVRDAVAPDQLWRDICHDLLPPSLRESNPSSTENFLLAFSEIDKNSKELDAWKKEENRQIAIGIEQRRPSLVRKGVEDLDLLQDLIELTSLESHYLTENVRIAERAGNAIASHALPLFRQALL